MRNKTKLFLLALCKTTAILICIHDTFVGTTNVEQSYQQIYQDFARQYPGHILPEKDLQWIFVNAGGWMGSMCLIHASLTEYVLFFGSALDTVGHSGKHSVKLHNTVTFQMLHHVCNIWFIYFLFFVIFDEKLQNWPTFSSFFCCNIWWKITELTKFVDLLPSICSI